MKWSWMGPLYDKSLIIEILDIKVNQIAKKKKIKNYEISSRSKEQLK